MCGSGCLRPAPLTSPPEKRTVDTSLENTHPWNAGTQWWHKASTEHSRVNEPGSRYSSPLTSRVVWENSQHFWACSLRCTMRIIALLLPIFRRLRESEKCYLWKDRTTTNPCLYTIWWRVTVTTGGGMLPWTKGWETDQETWDPLLAELPNLLMS